MAFPFRVVSWNVGVTNMKWTADERAASASATAAHTTSHNSYKVLDNICYILDNLAPACLLTQEWGLHETGLPIKSLREALTTHTGTDVSPKEPMKSEEGEATTTPTKPAVKRSYCACINGPYVTFVHQDYQVVSHELKMVDPRFQEWRKAQVVVIKSITGLSQTYRLVNVHAVSGGNKVTVQYDDGRIHIANHELTDRCRRQIFYAASTLLAGIDVTGAVPHNSKTTPAVWRDGPKTTELGIAVGDFNATEEFLKTCAAALGLSVGP